MREMIFGNMQKVLYRTDKEIFEKRYQEIILQ